MTDRAENAVLRVMGFTPLGWDWMHPAIRLPLCFLLFPYWLPLVFPFVLWMGWEMLYGDMREEYKQHHDSRFS